MRSTVAAGAFAVFAVFVWLPSSAAACSCASTGSQVEDARLILAETDAAFIGVLKTVRAIGDEPRNGEATPAGKAVFRYRVRRDFGKDLGRFVRVLSSGSSAACGLPARIGRKYAVGITGRRGRWNSNLCDTTRPRALRRAAAGASRVPPRAGACTA